MSTTEERHTSKDPLSDQIAIYERLQGDLENSRFGKWVVVHHEELAGTYESFEEAADDAVRRFGRGPYLIREVGAGAITLPASVSYRPVNADS